MIPRDKSIHSYCQLFFQSIRVSLNLRGKNDVVRFHISRDDTRDYSEDGKTLVFTVNTGSGSKTAYGLIYPQSNEFWVRKPYHARNTTDIDQAYSDLLFSSVVSIFEAIANGPERYFLKQVKNTVCVCFVVENYLMLILLHVDMVEFVAE